MEYLPTFGLNLWFSWTGRLCRSLLRLGSVNFAKDDDPTFRVAGWGRMAILIDGFAWDAWDERYIYRSMNG